MANEPSNPIVQAALQSWQGQHHNASKAEEQTQQPPETGPFQMENDGQGKDKERHRGVQDRGDAAGDVLRAPGDGREGEKGVEHAHKEVALPVPSGTRDASRCARTMTARTSVPKKTRVMAKVRGGISATPILMSMYEAPQMALSSRSQARFTRSMAMTPIQPMGGSLRGQGRRKRMPAILARGRACGQGRPSLGGVNTRRAPGGVTA